MARAFAKTNLGIWQDNDWRDLPFPVQHFYKMLWEHPELSYCGVVHWRPAKLSAWAAGLSKEMLSLFTDCLQARYFLVVDEETEECLVRSWVRWDGVIRQPRLAVSFANAYASLGSNTLRGVVIHEMKRLHEREPSAEGWAKDQVQQLFHQTSIDPRSLPVPEDPFAAGFMVEIATNSGSVSTSVSSVFRDRLDETHLGVSKSVSVPPTTATTTTPLQQLPAKPAHDDTATAPATDVAAEKFQEFWEVYGKKRDRKKAEQKWRLALKKPGITADLLIDAARKYVTAERQHNEGGRYIMEPTRWLNGERWNDDHEAPAQASDGRPRLTSVHDLEKPPSGLTDGEYLQWEWDQRQKRGQR